MNLVILVLYVCLNASGPHPCKEVNLVLDIASDRDCFIAGETKAIEWLDEHPGYRLVGVTCRWGIGEKKT